MKLIHQIGVCILMLPILINSQASGGELCEKKFTSVKQIYSVLEKETHVQKSHEDRDYVVLTDDITKVMWAFTKDHHPASPAVVCRYIKQKGDGIYMMLEARCGGDKPVCDRMVGQWQDLNKKITKELNN